MGGPYREHERAEGAPLAKPVASRAAVVLGAAATTSAMSVALLGSLELGLFAGLVGAFAAGAEVWRGRRRERLHRDVVRFLGSSVCAEAHGWRSLDGTRRVRQAPRDSGLRFEVLTRDGRHTLECYRRAPDDRLELDALPLEVRFARVHGRPLDPVCWDGSPPDLGGDPTRRDARWLRVSRFADGVLLERLDPFGDELGDTWHPDLDAAHEQIARELGTHAGELRSRPPIWDERPQRAWQ